MSKYITENAKATKSTHYPNCKENLKNDIRKKHTHPFQPHYHHKPLDSLHPFVPLYFHHHCLNFHCYPLNFHHHHFAAHIASAMLSLQALASELCHC